MSLPIKPCGRFSPAAWLLFFMLSLVLPEAAFPEDGRVDALLKEAGELRLHEKRAWHVLLHYKPSLIHGHKSLIDDPKFFLSPAGKTSPKAELEETIRAIFSENDLDDTHAQCRFVARYNWLKEELKFSGEPEALCKEYKNLVNTLKPASAVLIFPVSHMNSPASMFGHTLLRIDSGSESKLLSYAINYSAITDETSGFVFAFKGIFGYYKGYFSILPYYEDKGV